MDNAEEEHEVTLAGVNGECLDYKVRMSMLQGGRITKEVQTLDGSVRVCLVGENSKIPTQSNSSDAGWDLYASEDQLIAPLQRGLVKTGISLEIPDGYAGLIWPRSGLSVKSGVDVFAGVVDAGYRGEVGVCLFNSSDIELEIKTGDRIAQILFQNIPYFQLVEFNSLSSSDRGNGGFGSTGK